MVRLVGFLSLTTILVCNMVRHVAAKYPKSNGYVKDTYVFMDQDRELYSNPDILNIFTNHHYEVHPIGINSSHKNGPVK